jgi:hypothetical protein
MAAENAAGSRVGGKEVVPAATVLQGLGHTTVKGTFVQRAGLWLAGGVGGIIAIVTISLLVFLYEHYPPMPRPGAGAVAGGQYTIEEYKQLSEIAIKGTQDLFQTIVAQVLIPVFTAILGYIFGRGSRTGESE